MMPSHTVRILVATQPVDFRKGHDGLAALVQSVLKEDPFTGSVFVFRAKRSDRLKILFWDPACVRSTSRSRSNSATAFMTPMVSLPVDEVRSTPPRARQWTRTPIRSSAATLDGTLGSDFQRWRSTPETQPSVQPEAA